MLSVIIFWGGGSSASDSSPGRDASPSPRFRRPGLCRITQVKSANRVECRTACYMRVNNFDEGYLSKGRRGEYTYEGHWGVFWKFRRQMRDHLYPFAFGILCVRQVKTRNAWLHSKWGGGREQRAKTTTNLS